MRISHLRLAATGSDGVFHGAGSPCVCLQAVAGMATRRKSCGGPLGPALKDPPCGLPFVIVPAPSTDDLTTRQSLFGLMNVTLIVNQRTSLQKGVQYRIRSG